MRSPASVFLTVLCVLVSAPMSADEKQTLFDASPSDLGISLKLLRDAMHHSDVTGMHGYVTAAKLIIQHGLNLSQLHPDSAAEYNKALIGPTYNLAADTWPGWEDAHANAEEYRLIGLEAAHLNLKLREETEQGAVQRSRGHWIVGAHQIAGGQYSKAAYSFRQCLDLANEAGVEQTALMAQGWIHLANILAGMDESSELKEVELRLSSLGNEGAFLSDQFGHALSKFQNR